MADGPRRFTMGHQAPAVCADMSGFARFTYKSYTGVQHMPQVVRTARGPLEAGGRPLGERAGG